MKNINEFFAEGISLYRKKNPEINTYSKISNHTQIDYRVLQKIEQKTASLNRINFSKKIRLVKLLSKKSDFKQIIEKYKKDLGGEKIFQAYNEIYGVGNYQEEVEEKESLIKILDSYVSFKVYLLAMGNSGVTQDELIADMGLKSITALQILIEKKVLEQRNGSVYTIEDSVHHLPLELLVKYTGKLQEEYKIHNQGKFRNYLLTYVESLNDKGIKEAVQATLEYHQKMVKIFQNNENLGSQPFYINLTADTLLDKNIEQGRLQ